MEAVSDVFRDKTETSEALLTCFERPIRKKSRKNLFKSKQARRKLLHLFLEVGEYTQV